LSYWKDGTKNDDGNMDWDNVRLRGRDVLVLDRGALVSSAGAAIPCVPGKYINTIDEVLEWARTSRAGRQQMFPILHEREGCESKYGLCE